MKNCQAPNCQKLTRKGRYCSMHAERLRLKGTLEPEMRIPITVCTVEGCSKPHKCFGLCQSHYYRQRANGTTDLIKRNKTVPLCYAALEANTDDCIIWPMGLDAYGYGMVSENYKSLRAHKYVCKLAYGDAPTASHEVAHSCGKPACYNPRHLRWATHKENCADKKLHGTQQRGVKSAGTRLTEGDVMEIRLSAKTVGYSALAKRFNVTPQAIYLIVSRKNWAWLE